MLLTALLLLIVANGTPVLGWYLLGRRCDWPIDGGRRAADGRPWLGAAKTFRGILLSIAVTAAVAAASGLSWSLGAGFAALAMLGDLLSSFVKRRLGLVPSSRAPGLDQVPEAALPLFACAAALDLQAWDILLLIAAFWLVDALLSRLLYALHLRKRPY